MSNPIFAALKVDQVNKVTVCNWFLFWLCVILAVALGTLGIFVFSLLTGKTMMAWSMMPSLLLIAIAVANNYFVYAMCTKLPEGFTARI